MEKEREERKMKKGRLLLLAMLLVGMCFLFGCVRKDIPEENDPDSATNHPLNLQLQVTKKFPERTKLNRAQKTA